MYSEKNMTQTRFHSVCSGNCLQDEALIVGQGFVLSHGVLHPSCRRGNVIYWEDDTEKGCLWLYHHGLAAHGFIERNGKRQEFVWKAEDAEYLLHYTSGEKDIDYHLFMGTRIDPATSGFLLYGKLTFNGVTIIESFACDENGHIKPGESDNGFFRTHLTDKGNLAADLDLSSRWTLGEDLAHQMLGQDFNLWSASFVLSSDFASLSGTAIEQKTANGVSQAGASFSLSGSLCVAHDLPLQAPVLSEEKGQALRAGLLTVGDSPRSITELYTLPAPNMADANKLAAETLYYLAVYYVADKTFSCQGTDISWSNWFGLSKDKARDHVVDLDSRLLDLVDGQNARQEVKDFLLKYAQACLSDSYTGSSDATLTQALSGAKKRLSGQYAYCSLPDLCSYYLEGDGQTCLAQDPGYNLLLDEITRYAYMKLTPGLQKYRDDPQKNWAEDLYNQCCKNLQQLRITALTGNQGSTQVSHKSMMLTILDDQPHEISDSNQGDQKISMTYGAALYAKVFNLQLAAMADALGVEYTRCGEGEFIQMMRIIYGSLWDELQKQTSDYFSADILNQFQQLQKEYADLTKEEFIQSCVDMTQAGLDLLSNGASLTSLIPQLKSLCDKPWAAYSSQVCSIVFYAVSVASLSTVFMDWKDATAAEKAEAILTCVQSVANIAVSAIKFADIRTLVSSDASFEEKLNAALRLKFDGQDMSTIKSLANANGEEWDLGLDDMSARYRAKVIGSDEEIEQVSMGTRFFRVAEIAVRCLNVLMMGFIVVVSGLEIAKEIRAGGYNVSVYLEIISTSLLSLSCLCEAAALVTDIVGLSCACLPAIGAVAAFLGIIAQIVASCLKKPVNPLAAFIEDVIVPFLDSLTIPSAQWVKDHASTSNLVLA